MEMELITRMDQGCHGLRSQERQTRVRNGEAVCTAVAARAMHLSTCHTHTHTTDMRTCSHAHGPSLSHGRNKCTIPMYVNAILRCRDVCMSGWRACPRRPSLSSSHLHPPPDEDFCGLPRPSLRYSTQLRRLTWRPRPSAPWPRPVAASSRRALPT